MILNKNILHIIMDKVSLNHWKNKVKNINKEYFEIYYPDNDGGIRMYRMYYM